MMRADSILKQLLTCMSLISVIALVSLVGCGAPESPASFAEGSAGDPLNGGVITDDGKTFQLETDNRGLKKVAIVREDSAELLFDGTDTNGTDGIARLTDVTSGENTLSFDRNTELVEVSVEAPLGIGRVDFQASMADLNIGFLGNARTVNQVDPENLTCDEIVASVSEFCSLYDATAAPAKEEVIALAVSLAEEQLGSPIGNGFVTEVIEDFFGVLDDFCGAFQELIDGSAESPAVDPCS